MSEVSQEVIDRMVGRKSYWVDFECWEIEAGSPAEAAEKAKERLARAEFPAIVNIVENTDS